MHTHVRYVLYLAAGCMFIHGQRIYLLPPQCVQHLHTHLFTFHVYTQEILDEQKD